MVARSNSPYSGGTIPDSHRSSLVRMPGYVVEPRPYHGRVPDSSPPPAAGTPAASAPAAAIDLDAVLGDTRELWDDWLTDVTRRFRTIAELDVADLPVDRAAAAATLDAWAEHGIGDWRAALERFAEDCAPVYLRPDPVVNAALRALHAGGARLAAFTDAPEPLARVAAAQLGVARRLVSVEAGPGAEQRARAAAGPGATVVRSRDDLRTLAG